MTGPEMIKVERYASKFYTIGIIKGYVRAHNIWKQMLSEYEAPALDPAINEDLEAFIARRMEEGGVSDT